jgi:hypothetical protein
MSYYLPSHAIKLIREYSRPMTNPNWRKSKPIITPYKLYTHIIKLKSDKKLHDIILYHITDTEWYRAFEYIKYYGLNKYIKRVVREEYRNMLKADGIKEAIYYHAVMYY